MMRFIRTAGFAAALLLCTAPAFAQGAGIEWDTLNQEVMELHRAGHYDRAVVVAKKALDVAEKALGPDHPNVATRAVQRSPIDDLATAFEPVVVQRTAKARQGRRLNKSGDCRHPFRHSEGLRHAATDCPKNNGFLEPH